jgi:hypothetical protein
MDYAPLPAGPFGAHSPLRKKYFGVEMNSAPKYSEFTRICGCELCEAVRGYVGIEMTMEVRSC